MKGIIKTLNNASGHAETAYDTEAGVVEEAEKILASASKQRSALFDGKTKEQITDRDTGKILGEHEEILVVPPMAGG